jgi:hypothetical protein
VLNIRVVIEMDGKTFEGDLPQDSQFISQVTKPHTSWNDFWVEKTPEEVFHKVVNSLEAKTDSTGSPRSSVPRHENEPR